MAAVADLALALESFDLEADHEALHRDDFGRRPHRRADEWDLSGPDTRVDNPHQEFLWVLSEAGVLGLEALILRPVFYHLVELGEVRNIEGVEQLGVWSRGQFFALGHLQDLLRRVAGEQIVRLRGRNNADV